MVRADVFLRVLFWFLFARFRRLSEFSRGDSLAAAGGEMRSDYLKYSAVRNDLKIAPRGGGTMHFPPPLTIFLSVCFIHLEINLDNTKNTKNPRNAGVFESVLSSRFS